MTIAEFAEAVEKKEKAQLMKSKLDCESNWHNAETHIHYGRKWIRIDVGYSGRYMINAEGQIYGIKAAGVPHLGHRYGTLDAPLILKEGGQGDGIQG